ncbi:hypothetical protein ACEVCE_005111, partial [Salmonella enterica]
MLKDTADKAVTGLTGLKLKVSVPAGAAAWPDEMLVESDTTPGTYVMPGMTPTSVGDYVLTVSGLSGFVLSKTLKVTKAVPDNTLSSLVAAPASVAQGQVSAVTLTLRNTDGTPVSGEKALKLTWQKGSGESHTASLTEQGDKGQYTAEIPTASLAEGVYTLSVPDLKWFTKTASLTVGKVIPDAAASSLV